MVAIGSNRAVIMTVFSQIEKSHLLFVYSKTHDETDEQNLSFRYEIYKPLPKFKGKPYTSAIIVGTHFRPETAKYFDRFQDSVVVGIGTKDQIEIEPNKE